jgi:hypothetical protein
MFYDHITTVELDYKLLVRGFRLDRFMEERFNVLYRKSNHLNHLNSIFTPTTIEAITES